MELFERQLEDPSAAYTWPVVLIFSDEIMVDLRIFEYLAKPCRCLFRLFTKSLEIKFAMEKHVKILKRKRIYQDIAYFISVGIAISGSVLGFRLPQSRLTVRS